MVAREGLCRSFSTSNISFVLSMEFNSLGIFKHPLAVKLRNNVLWWCKQVLATIKRHGRWHIENLAKSIMHDLSLFCYFVSFMSKQSNCLFHDLEHALCNCKQQKRIHNDKIPPQNEKHHLCISVTKLEEYEILSDVTSINVKCCNKQLKLYVESISRKESL